MQHINYTIFSHDKLCCPYYFIYNINILLRRHIFNCAY